MTSTPATSSQGSASGGVPWEPPLPEQLQALLHGYEVLEMIGRGGMGAVYKARQLSLDRIVAIKILPPALWDDEEDYALRFRNEARVMARLMHPGMVAVFDFGETSDGQLYFVMEHVEGTDVARMIASQRRIAPMSALAITAHVCDTLRYAHEHGVIHRDIKPANVMVDMEGRVKVADFGLARLATAVDGHVHSTVAMGTPDFVAPEVLTLGAQVDHRADLYSLGVMLYEMLTGQVPRGIFALPGDCVEGLDRRFDGIVVRAMQADPAARYGTALELRRDLDHIVTVPVLKAPASHPVSGRPIQDHPTSKGPPWGLIVGGLAALIATTVFFLLQPKKKSPPPILVEAPPAALPLPAPVAPNPAAIPKPRPKPVAPPPKRTPVAQPPQVVTSPTPAPAPPPPRPETATTRKLQELETQFRAALARDVTTVHDTAVAELDNQYASALTRALASAKADETAALLEDQRRMQEDEPLPDSDGPEVPESLKFLHQTYRVSRAKRDAEKDKGVKDLHDKYEQVLIAYKAELIKAENVDGALEVSEKLKTWHSGSLAGEPLAKVEVDGTTMTPLRLGEKLYGSAKNYTWASIPDALQGCLFSKAAVSKKPTVHFKVLTDGVVQMACTSRWDRTGAGSDWKKDLTSEQQLIAQGWKFIDLAAQLKAKNENHTWLLYSRTCKAGESFTYRTEKYSKPFLIIRDPDANDADLPLAAFLPGTVWRWNGEKGEEMEFLKDGTVDQKNWIKRGLKTGWEVVATNAVKLTILSGRKDNLTASLIFPDDRKSFSGLNFVSKDELRKSVRVYDAPATTGSVK